MNRKEILNKIAIFSTLTDQELEILQSSLQQIEYDENITVFNENDAGDFMFIIENGVVDIKKQIPMSWGMETVRLARLQTGDIFGELSVFDEMPRSAAAITFFKTTLLAINKEHLQKFMLSNPTIAVKILTNLVQELSQRLRSTDEYVRDLTRKLFYL